jgi:hypothetical protein
VLGANERVHIVGWSEQPISASSWSPAQGTRELAGSRDAATGKWDVALDVGTTGWAKLHLRDA